MIVYRVCSKREISRIVSDKGFCGVGNYYDVNLKLNTFKYDDGVKYLHFYDRYVDIFILMLVRVGLYVNMIFQKRR